jgi:hypothetical protein
MKEDTIEVVRRVVSSGDDEGLGPTPSLRSRVDVTPANVHARPMARARRRWLRLKTVFIGGPATTANRLAAVSASLESLSVSSAPTTVARSACSRAEQVEASHRNANRARDGNTGTCEGSHAGRDRWRQRRQISPLPAHPLVAPRVCGRLGKPSYRSDAGKSAGP